jgi:hypothetical protein
MSERSEQTTHPAEASNQNTNNEDPAGAWITKCSSESEPASPSPSDIDDLGESVLNTQLLNSVLQNIEKFEREFQGARRKASAGDKPPGEPEQSEEGDGDEDRQRDGEREGDGRTEEPAEEEPKEETRLELRPRPCLKLLFFFAYEYALIRLWFRKESDSAK